MKPKHYTIAAIVLFIAATAFALVHGIAGARYAGFNSQEYVGLFKGPSMVLDGFLALLWAASAFGLLLRKSAPSYILAALGALVMASHGLLFSLTTTTPIGLAFLGGAALIAFCLKRSWSGTPKTTSNEASRDSRLSWSH